MHALLSYEQGSEEELSSARPSLPRPPRRLVRWPGWGWSGYPVSTHYALGMRLSLVARRQAVSFLMRVRGFPMEIAVCIARLWAADFLQCLHHIVICPSCGGLLCSVCASTNVHAQPCKCVLRGRRRSIRVREGMYDYGRPADLSDWRVETTLLE